MITGVSQPRSIKLEEQATLLRHAVRVVRVDEQDGGGVAFQLRDECSVQIRKVAYTRVELRVLFHAI
jgi:hypothetical protein